MGEIKLNISKITDAARQYGNYQGCARIMIDLADGEVWTDVFTSTNSFEDYHAETIICVLGKDDLHGRNGKVSAEKLEKYCNKLIELYRNILSGRWEMWELESAWGDIWYTL